MGARYGKNYYIEKKIIDCISDLTLPGMNGLIRSTDSSSVNTITVNFMTKVMFHSNAVQ